MRPIKFQMWLVLVRVAHKVLRWMGPRLIRPDDHFTPEQWETTRKLIKEINHHEYRKTHPHS